MYTSFKLHCLNRVPLFFSFNAAAVLEASEELTSLIFARLFKFQYSVAKATIASILPTQQLSSHRSTEEQNRNTLQNLWVGLLSLPSLRMLQNLPSSWMKLGLTSYTAHKPVLSAPTTVKLISDAEPRCQLVLTSFRQND